MDIVEIATPIELSADQRPLLARRIVERHFYLHPELSRQDAEERARVLDMADSQLRYLREALATNRNELFVDQIAWTRATGNARGMPERKLLDLLASLEQVVREDFPPHEVDRILNAIAAARSGMDASPPSVSYLLEDAPLAELAQEYLDALLGLNRHRAYALIETALEQGATIADIYLGVFQPVLREVGRLWQLNHLGVAHEHFISAATQTIMSRLYPRIFGSQRVDRRLVMACVGDELHEIGARMVADLFELAGWDTLYLGANVEATDLAALLSRESPDLLCLSVTLGEHLGMLREQIQQVRQEPGCAGVKILVGGQPFNLAPSLWRQLGADGYATNATEAVAVVTSLFPDTTDATR